MQMYSLEQNLMQKLAGKIISIDEDRQKVKAKKRIKTYVNAT